MSITAKQWYQIITGVISGLITGAALMQTLLGQDLTIKIVAGLGILNIIVSSIGTALSSQGSDIKSVLAMPGIEKVTVNDKANQTLAAIAVDPTVNKIAPTQAAQIEVMATAKGAAS